MARPATLVVAAVIVALLVAAPAESAFSCGHAMFTLLPCSRYLNDPKRSNVPACCGAIQKLISSSSKISTADRQDVCNCISRQTRRLDGHKLTLMENLFGRCRIYVPYNPINYLRAECSRVH